MTLLDDLRLFVQDSQAAAYYRKWARDNPAALHDWEQFRDGLLTGQRPVPPDMGGNRYGAALVDAGRLYLDATIPAEPPPPRVAPLGEVWTSPSPRYVDSGCYR